MLLVHIPFFGFLSTLVYYLRLTCDGMSYSLPVVHYCYYDTIETLKYNCPSQPSKYARDVEYQELASFHNSSVYSKLLFPSVKSTV